MARTQEQFNTSRQGRGLMDGLGRNSRPDCPYADQRQAVDTRNPTDRNVRRGMGNTKGSSGSRGRR
jgi:hypothetical protein